MNFKISKIAPAIFCRINSGVPSTIFQKLLGLFQEFILRLLQLILKFIYRFFKDSSRGSFRDFSWTTFWESILFFFSEFLLVFLKNFFSGIPSEAYDIFSRISPINLSAISSGSTLRFFRILFILDAFFDSSKSSFEDSFSSFFCYAFRSCSWQSSSNCLTDFSWKFWGFSRSRFRDFYRSSF